MKKIMVIDVTGPVPVMANATNDGAPYAPGELVKVLKNNGLYELANLVERANEPKLALAA